MRHLRKITVLVLLAGLVPACGPTTPQNPFAVQILPGAVTAPDGNVPLQCDIFFFFSMPVDVATISTTNFFVSPAGGGPPVGNTSVTYFPQCESGPCVILTIGTPYLTENSSYIVTVTSAVLDTSGDVLPATQIQFTTTGTAPLTSAVSFGGVTNVAAGAVPGSGVINLTWSAASGGNNANYTYEVYFSTISGGEDLTLAYAGPGSPIQTGGGASVTLASGVAYWFIVRAHDGDGNMDSNVMERGGVVAP